QGRREVDQVVLVVGLVGVPDHRRRGRRQVVRVRGRGVVLEGLVVGDVVALGPPVRRYTPIGRVGRAPWLPSGSAERSPPVVGGSLPITGCLGAWPRPRGGGPEPALEPAPGEAGGVQEVAEVATVHAVLSDLHGVAGRAVVQQRLWVADDRLP